MHFLSFVLVLPAVGLAAATPIVQDRGSGMPFLITTFSGSIVEAYQTLRMWNYGYERHPRRLIRGNR